MATAPQEAQRYCKHCGERLWRKRYACGKLESPANWAERLYCDRKCANLARRVGRDRSGLGPERIPASLRRQRQAERQVPEHLRPALAVFVKAVQHDSLMDGAKLSNLIQNAASRVRIEDVDERDREARMIAEQEAGWQATRFLEVAR